MSAAARFRDLPFRALGDQPAFRPADVDPFLAAPRIAVLAYVRADGRPCQTPIWYDVEGARFVMKTVTGAPKHRALLRDPRVCVTVQDEAPAYRAIIADGIAELEDLPKGATDAELALRYLGRLGAQAYAAETDALYASAGLTRITVAPESLRGFDNNVPLSPALRLFAKARPHLPIPNRWI